MERELVERLMTDIENVLSSGKRLDGRQLSDDNLLILWMVCGGDGRKLPNRDRACELARKLPIVALIGK